MEYAAGTAHIRSSDETPSPSSFTTFREALGKPAESRDAFKYPGWHVRSTEFAPSTFFTILSRRKAYFQIKLLTAFSLLCILVFFLSYPASLLPLPSRSHQTTGAFRSKPSGFKIYALVPYGRRQNVKVLDCYLRRNLVRNGGWLDEVHFPIYTLNALDIAWIQSLAANVSEYKIIYLDEKKDLFHFYDLYDQSLIRGQLYLKIDDDMIYMSDTAIKEAVTVLLDHPEAFLVSANIVNSMELGWLHMRRGAIHTYLPESTAPEKPDPASYGPLAWRASKLPTHNDSLEWNRTALTDPQFREPVEIHFSPPYPKHRWLPFRDNDTNLPSTPMWYSNYRMDGTDYYSWEHAAQQHYSLLENIEKEELDLYDFGGLQGIWNMRYHHSNLNFFAAWADDILLANTLERLEGWNDEWHFTMRAPRVMKKQVLVATRSLAAHYSQGTQREGIEQTDLMERWRAYANDRVCASEIQGAR